MEDANGQPVSLGSGFFVRDEIVATNLHVVRGASRGKAKLVGQPNTYAFSDLVAVDADADLVLISVPGARAPKLHLGDSNELAVGDVVYAIGNPEGLEGTFSQGIVSGIRSIGTDKLLQITAPISPGSSGGPIIDTSGNVVGVAVATFREGQNLNFAIPVSYLATLLKNMGNPRPFSGVKEVQRESKPSASGLGEKSTDAVIGTDFVWSGIGVSFTLLNQTASPVRDIRFLIVFLKNDKKKGYSPIDYLEGETCKDVVILPHLPKRQETFYQTSEFPGTGFCGVLLSNEQTQNKTRHVEIRVLDFKLAD
jgi:S1-C subfamily serine protease